MRIYKYLDKLIVPCERVGGEHEGRWVVRSRHKVTGLYYADELCTHYRTLAEARQALREAVRQAPD